MLKETNHVVLGAEWTVPVLICLGLITRGGAHPLERGSVVGSWDFRWNGQCSAPWNDQTVAYELESRQFS